MFYIAKITYYDVNFSDAMTDDSGIPMIHVPTEKQLEHFTIKILISATNLNDAKKAIEQAFQSALEEIIYLKPTNLKIIDIDEIVDIQNEIEEKYLNEED